MNVPSKPNQKNSLLVQAGTHLANFHSESFWWTDRQQISQSVALWHSPDHRPRQFDNIKHVWYIFIASDSFSECAHPGKVYLSNYWRMKFNSSAIDTPDCRSKCECGVILVWLFSFWQRAFFIEGQQEHFWGIQNCWNCSIPKLQLQGIQTITFQNIAQGILFYENALLNFTWMHHQSNNLI